MTDALTGLTNRRGAEARLEELVAQCRDAGGTLAVLQLDLDGFKPLNDSLGHDAGDFVLPVVAERLGTVLRPGDLLARVGGDEFMLAMVCRDEPERPHDVAARLVGLIAEPIQFDGRPCLVGASVGIATGAGDDLTGPELVKGADLALYRAKGSGRNRTAVFNDALRAEAEWTARIGDDLAVAIERGEIVAYLQPVVQAGDHALVGAEALVRWEHPEFGLLTPDRFLPIARDLRLTADLDHEVLRQACAALKGWREAGLQAPALSVNASLERLRDPDLLRKIGTLDLPEGVLEFEILETVLAQTCDRVLDWNLDGLREAGIALAIDGFGTGTASIRSILAVRPRRIKIDRDVAGSVVANRRSADAVRLSVAMARALDVPVTAEGVERPEQARRLRELGCDRLQGFLFGRPETQAAFADRLRADQAARGPDPDRRRTG